MAAPAPPPPPLPPPVGFITAASSSCGYQVAYAALQKGDHVIATARDPTKIQRLEKEGAYNLAFDHAFSKYGRIDYLINAAGYILEGAVEEVTPDEAQRHYNVIVFGTTNTIRAFVPLRKD
ncbi:hypothetical protein N7532_011677 [Penicillium argentinense]|uniref:Uncharacterized protein n=1 Tax=Penicillium argentinense TaxID=1131581 RepID=A0A9W9JUS9_9EURO|nr:uncharacterized protein N7532_011677 [Penicillium argentinense]KAJ5082634.1 hypothetical protein N7532_011677 [Penicillium argentinense]